MGLLLPRAARAQAEELPPAAMGTGPSAPDASTRAPQPSGPASPQQSTVPAPTGPAPSSDTRGIVFAPYLGFNLPMGSTLDNYSLGFRLGALLGWHVSPGLSLNGECSLDFVDADTDSSFWRPHEHTIDVAMSPLVHIRSSRIVVGPKVGWFSNARSSPTLTWNGQGVLFGLNAGLFIPVRRVMVGGLLGAALREFTSFSCVDQATLPSPETCGYHRNPTKTVGLTGAVLF